MFLLSTPWLKQGSLEAFYLSFACSLGRGSLTHRDKDWITLLALPFNLLLQNETR